MQKRNFLLLCYGTYLIGALAVAYLTVSTEVNKGSQTATHFGNYVKRYVASSQSSQSETVTPCQYNTDCGNGTCIADGDRKYCKCDTYYMNYQDGVCNYKQSDKLTLFLLSFFLGEIGIDWFLLAVVGSAGFSAYCAAGFFKLITCGGVGIWWLIDWVLILCNRFPDSAGIPLSTANMP